MANVPPRKKIKHGKQSVTSTEPKYAGNYNLFAPFRALGFITNHVPFSVQTLTTKGSSLPPRIHIVTCLGRAWAMWEGDKMTLLFVGPDLEQPISSIVMDGDAVWAASGSLVTKFLRGKQVAQLVNPHDTAIAVIAVFGSQMLGLTDDGNNLVIWDMNTLDVVRNISFGKNFTANHILHPATYLNKILISSAEGGLELWNISTATCIHRFDPTKLRPTPHAKHAPNLSTITSLVQSPAVDIVGIGFASGEVSVYDIRADERLLSVNMGTGAGMSTSGDTGRITALGFRSDGEPILATASSTGHIAFWDLNAGARLLHVFRGAHDGAITALEWIPGQPLLLSSGDDNSVKQWLFDSPTAPPRLLKFRGGHQVPPHLIRYYGDDGKQLLTASRDRSLRCTSVVRDSRSFELSQGSLAKKSSNLSVPLSHFKFPPITSLSFSSSRSKDWEDVLTAHTSSTAGQNGKSNAGGASSTSFARTWSVQNKRVGRWNMALSPNAFSPAAGSKKAVRAGGVVRCVFVTVCGNFGLAGSSVGEIALWNMQSGIRRKTFDVGSLEQSTGLDATNPDEPPKKTKAKERVITGVAVDSLNRVMVAATLDGTLNFFDFHTTKLEHVVHLHSSAVSLLLHQDSGLIAVICDDLVVRLVDLETRRIVRELRGFRGRILDVTFSPDSRWLISTSLDSIIRTFDIPTGRLIDAFKTASVATSVTFSPTGDFLATSHVDSVGVYLWANRAQYSEVSLQTVIDDESTTKTTVSLPSVQGVAEEAALDNLSALLPDTPADVYTTPEQLGVELATLTLLPRSKWQTLLNLETIIQRNKPKEAPKAPEKAPFFLPTLPGVEHRFAVDQEPKQSAVEKKESRRVGKADIESDFVIRLLDEDVSGDYEGFFSYIKMLSPAAIDLELRSLVSFQRASDALKAFIGALSGRLRTHRDFEAVQTFMAVFLRLHGDVLAQNEVEDEDDSLNEALEGLLDVQRTESERVLDLIDSALGTLSFVRDTI